MCVKNGKKLTKRTKNESNLPTSIARGKKDNTISTNQEKIADAMYALMQENIENEINLEEIEIEAEKKAQKWVEATYSNNVNKIDFNTIKMDRDEEVNLAKLIYMEEMVKEKLNEVYSIKFDDLIEATNIKTTRVNYIVDTLIEAKNQANYIVSRVKMLDGNIKKVVSAITLIPQIDFVLTDEGAAVYKDAEDWLKSAKKNKKKYLDCINLTINTDTIAYLLVSARHRGFVLVDKKYRNFKYKYTYKLDSLLRATINVQHIKKLNTFSIEDLKARLGVPKNAYKEYREFKRRVLNISISEINEKCEYSVESVENRLDNAKKGEVVSISFKIKRKKQTVEDTENKQIAYYIANQYVRWGKGKNIKSIAAFAKATILPLLNDKESEFADRSIESWVNEAKLNLQAEIQLKELILKNKSFCDNWGSDYGLKYSEKKQTLVVLVDANQEEKNLYNYLDDIVLKEQYIKNNENELIKKPIDALLFLNEEIKLKMTLGWSISYFFPFSFYSTNQDKSFKIDDMSSFSNLSDEILKAIKTKNINYFKFIINGDDKSNMAEDSKRELFIDCVEKQNFIELVESGARNIEIIKEFAEQLKS